MPLRPPATTKRRAGAGAFSSTTSHAAAVGIGAHPRRSPGRHVVAVAVVVARDRAHRGGVAVPARGGGAAHGRTVVAAAAAGAPLRAPRRARAGLPLLLRQLHRAHPAHGRRVLPPRAARGAPRRAPQGARLLPPLEEALRSNAHDLVREHAAADRQRAGADPGGAAVAGGALRPVRGAPAHRPVRGPRPQQPPRRRVGAPPQDPHARLPRREPQAAGAFRRRDGAADAGGARAVVRGGRRGGGGRRGVVPAAAAGGHHARHVRPELRRGQRRVPAAGRARQLRHRGAQQGLHARLQVPPDEEEQARLAAGQGDQEAPGQVRDRPAERRPPGRGPGPRARRGHEGLHELHGAGHDGGRDNRGVQELLLRREGDADKPPHLGDRRARYAPGVAGPRSPGGRRRLRPPGPAHKGPPPQAQNPGDDRERDAEALPAGGGDDPEGEAGRGSRRVRGAGGHGDHDADHGRAPRRRGVGRRRHGVQPRAIRGRRRPAAAADGVHAVRRRRAGVHRPEPGADRGQGGAGTRPAAVRVPAVAGVRARAQGAHDTQPAARRTGHLPAVVTRHACSRGSSEIPIGFN